MKTYTHLYQSIISFENLILAWQKARKGKTKKEYVITFENELFCNLMTLHYELKYDAYNPRPLVTFILRDPKTRRISKSEFRDRVVHHALVNVLEPLFDKTFIADSCANRIGKGTLYAMKRFVQYLRKVSQNGKVAKNQFQDRNYITGYCLKADIKQYFQEVNHSILMKLIARKVADRKVLQLIQKINANFGTQRERERESNRSDEALGVSPTQGMPLGNLTSQFFANIYLNELDQFVKHTLKAQYYIRYVDDFIILHQSRTQLEAWKQTIDAFLREQLQLTLHPQKSHITLYHLHEGLIL